MNNDTDLTPFEERLLMRSGDMRIVERRRTAALLTSAIFVALFVIAAFVTESWRLLLVIGVAYVLISLGEKLSHIRAVGAYKTLVKKLCLRNKELGGE